MQTLTLPFCTISVSEARNNDDNNKNSVSLQTAAAAAAAVCAIHQSLRMFVCASAVTSIAIVVFTSGGAHSRAQVCCSEQRRWRRLQRCALVDFSRRLDRRSRARISGASGFFLLLSSQPTAAAACRRCTVAHARRTRARAMPQTNGLVAVAAASVKRKSRSLD